MILIMPGLCVILQCLSRHKLKQQNHGEMVNREEIFSNLNKGMLSERARIFRINLEKNLPLIRHYGGLVSITENLKNKNVIILGAGPNLEKDIPLLKKYRDRLDIVYIAADMALRPLLVHGVNPHYVITCETTPLDFFSGIDTSKIHLLAFSCSSSTNLRSWKGKISFYNWMMDSDFFNELWEIAGRDLGFVATGSIVLTQAVSIALGCGISGLVLAGNDLGFTDRYYLAGAVSAEKRYGYSWRLNPHVTIDMNTVRRSRDYEVVRNNRVAYTNHQFLAAKMWLEDLFKKGTFSVVDSSYPGCSGDAVIKMGLKEYFSNLYKPRKRRK